MARPKKPLNELTKESELKREYYERYPEQREKQNKRVKDWINKNPERYRKKKSDTQKKRFIQAITMLGDCCESCGEKFDSNAKKSNLEIHHLRYDERDKERRAKWGTIGEIFRDVLRMAKLGENPKKKFTLLCQQCNVLEAWIRKNPDKALSAFAWCVEQGIIDVETPNPEGNTQIDEFIKSENS